MRESERERERKREKERERERERERENLLISKNCVVKSRIQTDDVFGSLLQIKYNL